MRRQGQTWALEMYVAVSVFLIALIAFYALIAVKSPQHTVKKEAERIAASLSDIEYFDDGELSTNDVVALEALTCDDLRTMFGITDPDTKVCIYLKDQNGAFVDFVTKKTIGCQGFQVASGATLAGDVSCGVD